MKGAVPTALIACTAAAGLIVGACAGDSAPAVAEPPGETTDLILDAEFQHCPFNDQVEFSAGGWAGSVAGEVTCDQAGALIQHHFGRDAGQSGVLSQSDADSIRTSDPARFSSAGYECATFPLPDGMGWHILCADPASRISFYFTP